MLRLNMNKIFIILAFIGQFCLASSNNDSKNFPPCHIKKQAKIAFSSLEPTNVLKLSVEGAPCYKAMLNIQIVGEKGNKIYSYLTNFKTHTPVSWEDPSLPSVAEALVNDIISSAAEHSEVSSELPPWLPQAEYQDNNFSTIQVSKEEYERIRREKHYLFTHLIHYEEWHTLIYDPKTGKAQLFLVGGV
jgi:hypothetical protein